MHSKGVVNPKALEVMNRSIGHPVPAKAHAPKGAEIHPGPTIYQTTSITLNLHNK